MLAWHPGASGQFGLIRFTAPTNGQYQIAAAFFGVDIVGTTTDVHILTNGVPSSTAWSTVIGPGSGTTNNLTVRLNAGGFIDFAVGWGSIRSSRTIPPACPLKSPVCRAFLRLTTQPASQLAILGSTSPSTSPPRALRP